MGLFLSVRRKVFSTGPPEKLKCLKTGDIIIKLSINRYLMAGLLPIRRHTSSNQSINHDIVDCFEYAMVYNHKSLHYISLCSL